MKFLQTLGVKYGTDKSDAHHSFNGESYLDVYERMFTSMKQTAKVVLELGVYKGASLRTWQDYFLNAQIWGLDANSEALEVVGPRLHIVIGRQVNKDALAACAPGEQFDVVVDDCSHLVDSMITSFKELWPRVRSGGFYAIEDTGMTYGVTHYLLDAEDKPVFNEEGVLNSRSAFEVFVQKLIAEMDHKKGDIKAITFTHMQVFFEKV